MTPEPQWSYSSSRNFTEWYGRVDYYGQYVIGRWFALDAESGTEFWSKRFFSMRPTHVCDCAHDVIVAKEMTDNGPSTSSLGIYGIDAKSGKLLWTNHGRGAWGKLLRCLDYVPALTNEMRDTAKCIVDEYVVTRAGRILNIRTGRDCPSANVNTPSGTGESSPDQILYDNKSMEMDGDTINVEGPHDHSVDLRKGSHDDFVVLRRDQSGRDIWRFSAKDLSSHVEGDYHSYRLHDGHIYIMLGDAPNLVPINESKPLIVKANPNPANFQLGVLDLSSGECQLYPLAEAKRRKECRIEAIRGDRILASCDGRQLVEYKLTT